MAPIIRMQNTHAVPQNVHTCLFHAFLSHRMRFIAPQKQTGSSAVAAIADRTAYIRRTVYWQIIKPVSVTSL